MIWPIGGRSAVNRRRRGDPFTRATHGDLDIIMPPPYDLTEASQTEGRARVEEHLRRLQPGGLDAGSREVLNNLINAWADVAIAQLDGERDERQAVGDVLIGLAREEVVRRKPRYDIDLTRALQAREALEAAFSALTGKKTTELSESWPTRFDESPVGSTLGPVRLVEDQPSSVHAGDPDPPLQFGDPLPGATGNTPLHTSNGGPNVHRSQPQ